MRINICDGDDSFKIAIPNGLFLSNCAAFGLHRMLKKKGINIKTRNIRKLMKEIRKYNKKNGSWELVQINSDDGERITVSI